VAVNLNGVTEITLSWHFADLAVTGETRLLFPGMLALDIMMLEAGGLVQPIHAEGQMEQSLEGAGGTAG
jgi:hypothetical protein